MAYATRADVYAYGLPRGSLYLHARAVAAVNVAGNWLEVEGHGCETDDAIQFRTEDGSLAAPLATGTTYYAEPLDESRLRVRASAGGSALDLTTTGEHMDLVVPVGPQMDALLETFSRWIDSMLVGHEVPLEEPYPQWVTYVVAVRTAAALARILGLGTAGDRIYEAERAAIADAQRMAKGVPLRPEVAPSNLARGSSPVPARMGGGTLIP